MEEVRAYNVIMLDDDGDVDEVQVEVPAPEAPPLSIKIEHEPVLRRGTRNRVQR